MRMLTLAAVLAAAATPALGESATPTGAANATLSETAAQLSARQHLVRQGYINVSTLEKDDYGRWSGTAQKDGKTVIVAIDLRRMPDAGAAK